MIPVRWHRVFIVFFGISVLLASADMGLHALGISGLPLVVGTGLIAGVVVFVAAIEGGVLLRFCAKGLVAQRYISSMTKDLMASVGCGNLGIRVSPMDSDAIFAVTVSEGRFSRTFISRGLLVKFSQSGVLGVAAHECGHVIGGHTKRLAALLGLLSAVKFSVDVPFFAALAVLFAFLWLLRQWEYEADARAVNLVGSKALITAFEDYEKATGKSEASNIALSLSDDSPRGRSWISVWLDSFLELFMGHPRIEHRVERIVNGNGCGQNSE